MYLYTLGGAGKSCGRSLTQQIHYSLTVSSLRRSGTFSRWAGHVAEESGGDLGGGSPPSSTMYTMCIYIYMCTYPRVTRGDKGGP